MKRVLVLLCGGWLILLLLIGSVANRVTADPRAPIREILSLRTSAITTVAVYLIPCDSTHSGAMVMVYRDTATPGYRPTRFALPTAPPCKEGLSIGFPDPQP